MTKQECIARLLHEPVVIEPLPTAGYHRPHSLHADHEPKRMASGSRSRLPGERRSIGIAERPTPCVGGRRLRLTDREVEGIVSRLRGLFLQQLATAVSEEIART